MHIKQAKYQKSHYKYIKKNTEKQPDDVPYMSLLAELGLQI